MEWKKEERIEKRKLITIICLLFNSLRNLNQYDHLGKGAPLRTPGTLSCLVPTLSSGCSLYFFSPFFLSILLRATLSQAWTLSKKKKQSFLQGAPVYQERDEQVDT